MEARAAVKVVEPVVADDAPAVRPAIVASRPEAPPARPSGRRPSRAVARPIALNRADEYRFIRADLNRLLITASALLLLMLALLFVVGR